MKTLFIFTTLLLAAITVPTSHSYAQDPEPAGATTEKSADVLVSVNGLVCDFCARALEKTFGKQDEVLSIGVNLDTKIVSVYFKEGQSLDDETITKLITDSGYNVEGIEHAE